jgi:hypothetical protein
VSRPSLEVADIFHRHGATWRAAHVGHLSLGQMKVMSAIESCRTAALGGHVEACEDCGHSRIAYNSCRNRHCPKCQSAAARDWLAARQADLLPVGYFHVVFTLPAEIADIAYYNKAVIYDLLFRAASEALLTIAAAMSMLRREDDHHRDLRTWQRPRPRTAIDENVMTTNRPSSLCIPAEGPDHWRPEAIVRLRPIACPAPSATPKPAVLQGPHRNAHGHRKPVDLHLPIHAAHRRGRTGPSRTVKSP